MKTTYLDNAVSLLEILEKELLILEKDNDSQKETFKLKTISTKELEDIEIKIREQISNLYYTCQVDYIQGIEVLDTYFYDKEQLEL